MNYGFAKVAAAVPELKVADCEFNTNKIIELITEAQAKDVQFVVFPELCITSYTCQDLFHQDVLIKEALKHLKRVLEITKNSRIVAIVGIPIAFESKLYNCAVVLQDGEVLGVVPKTYIPGYGEFYEERWFSSAKNINLEEIVLFGKAIPFGTDILFEESKNKNICFGIEICEDVWVPLPPSSYQALSGATITFNLSSSNEIIGKHEYRKELLKLQSAKCISGYVYASSGSDESSTDLVFGGYSAICEYGTCLNESERFLQGNHIIYSEIDIEKIINLRRRTTSFSEGILPFEYKRVLFELEYTEVRKLERYIDPRPFVPSKKELRDIRCKEIFSIQSSALIKRLKHTNIKHAVIGISGGVDSTLALLVICQAFDMLEISRENIIAITMPGFGTTDITYNNAIFLMKAMSVTIKEVDIKNACLTHFNDIGHDPEVHDVTFENAQARERTQILMDIANKIGGLVIGTGDLSELAIGWCTYNADHMSMYSVNCGIPKTLVKFLIQWYADKKCKSDIKNILYDVINTPISPELIPPSLDGKIKQKTEDIVGPYELHDFFLYHMMRYGASPKKILYLANQAFEGTFTINEIKKWLKIFLKRFFSQQFKRSCLPDGPKVGTISLSPRGDLKMPSDACVSIWMKELEE